MLGMLIFAPDGVSPPALILGVLGFLLTLGLFSLLLFIKGNWDDWEPALCLSAPRGCFCEKPRMDSLVRQPANTFSNLAFTIVGVLVLLETIQRKIQRSRMRLPVSQEDDLGTAFSCTYAIGQIVLGAGSSWFHCSLTFSGQWIDNAAMYLSASAPMLYGLAYSRLARGEKNVTRRYVLEWLFVSVSLSVLVLYVPSVRRYVFAPLILGVIVVELYMRRLFPKRARILKLSYFGASLIFCLIAFAIWTLDITHIVCYPDSLLQGHALWHILLGMSSLLIYCYYIPAIYSLPSSTKDKE